jgi:hypothetical protein
MTPQQTTFLLAGLTAGLVTVVGARAWPTLLPMLLVCGVGPLFFVAVLTAITLTGSWSHLSHGWWRIVAGICICTGAYLLAFFTFLVVVGYSGIPTSTDQIRFGADVWIGLLAAALVASACIELLVFVLTGKWSNSFLFRLAAAGVVTVLVTLAVDLAAHHYWTFYGILLPVGEGLFCWLVGAQIWRASQQLTVPAM